VAIKELEDLDSDSPGLLSMIDEGTLEANAGMFEDELRGFKQKGRSKDEH